MKQTGLSNSYYELPEGATELQDLIEHKGMDFATGNIFKAAYRLGDKPGTETEYDLEKIIWFASRKLQQIRKDNVKEMVTTITTPYPDVFYDPYPSPNVGFRWDGITDWEVLSRSGKGDTGSM